MIRNYPKTCINGSEFIPRNFENVIISNLARAVNRQPCLPRGMTRRAVPTRHASNFRRNPFTVVSSTAVLNLHSWCCFPTTSNRSIRSNSRKSLIGASQFHVSSLHSLLSKSFNPAYEHSAVLANDPKAYAKPSDAIPRNFEKLYFFDFLVSWKNLFVQIDFSKTHRQSQRIHSWTCRDLI